MLRTSSAKIFHRTTSTSTAPFYNSKRTHQTLWRSFSNMNASMSEDTPSFPVQASITRKLTEALEPEVLRVVNESHMHNVPKNSETHFKVIIVSNQFNEIKSLIKRHRMVNTILSDEIATEGPVHALSIVAKNPAQWEKMVEKSKAEGENDVNVGASPSCRGGDGSLPPKNS